MDKDLVVILGLISTLGFGIIGICPIFFGGFQYWYVDFTWLEDGPFNVMAGVQTACVVVLFAVFLIGLYAFTAGKQHSGPILIFGVFDLLSFIFSFSVAVYVLVSSQIGNNELTQSCSQGYKGIFKHFLDVDKVMTKIDEKLCSSECPCNFNTDSGLEAFLQNATIYDDFMDRYWKLHSDDDPDLVKNIKECYEKKGYISGLNNNAQIKVGKINKFFKFWERVEKKFDCTGWCSNNYIGEYAQKKFIYKYLFSDVSRGMPKRMCMNPYKNWLVRMLKAYGSLLLIASVLQFAACIFALYLLFHRGEESRKTEIVEKDEEQNVVQHSEGVPVNQEQ